MALVWRPALQKEDVETGEAHLVYNGIFQVYTWTLRHRYFDGRWGPWVSRGQVCRRQAAAILLFAPQNDSFILVEQFRVGLLGMSQAPWMLEVVAGLCGEGEKAKTTAVREAVEEAGCEVAHVLPIGDFFNSPGSASEKTSVFLGIVDELPSQQGGGLSEEAEDIRIHVLPTQSVLLAYEEGQFLSSAATCVALQWFMRKKEEIVAHYG